jgi:hypothetical protein
MKLLLTSCFSADREDGPDRDGRGQLRENSSESGAINLPKAG